MVWDYNINIVVMATELQEAGKQKCERYFPLVNRKLKYAGITIMNLEAEQSQGYIKTKLQLEKNGRYKHAVA